MNTLLARRSFFARATAILGAAFAIIAVAGALGTSAETTGWVRVDKSMLHGKLRSDPEAADKGLPANYFDELEPAVDMKFGSVYLGSNTTTVFQTQQNISRSFDFPGDEVVRVMSGTITLIDEPSGRVQTFYRGQYFVVPRHWRGLWIFHNLGPEAAREFVTLSGPAWSPDRPPLNRATLSKTAKTPVALAVDLHEAETHLAPMGFSAPGLSATLHKDRKSQLGSIIFAGEPSLLMLKSPKGSTYERQPTQCESTVRVLSGSLTLLPTRGKRDTFVADDTVVITHNFRGEIRTSAGFTALSSIVAGGENLTSPDVAPATRVCPAM